MLSGIKQVRRLHQARRKLKLPARIVLATRFQQQLACVHMLQVPALRW
jgi:hypothetical protein